MRFDHIGIVVANLSAGRKLLQTIFDIENWTRSFSDAANDVCVQFGRDRNGICYELIAPLSLKSPVQRVLRTGNNVTNHVAYLVVDLVAARTKLIAADFSIVSKPKPAVAYEGAQIQFFMSPIFSLVELVEAPHHEHQYLAASCIADDAS